MNKEEFDRQFDTLFEDAVHNHLPAPDPNPSWDKIERKLGKQAKRRSLIKLVPSLVASFILGAVVFGLPAVTQAFNPLVATIKNLSTDVVSVVFGKPFTDLSKAKTAPPPDEPVKDSLLSSANGEQKHYQSWDEASKHVLFTPFKIKHVAQGFKLSDVMLIFYSGEEKTKTAVIMYSNASSNKSYMIRLRVLEKNEQLKEDYDKNFGKLEEVQINGQPAYLFSVTDGRTSLDFLLGNVLVSISGGLSKEEIMKVGENMKS